MSHHQFVTGNKMAISMISTHLPIELPLNSHHLSMVSMVRSRVENRQGWCWSSNWKKDGHSELSAMLGAEIDGVFREKVKDGLFKMAYL